MGRSCSVGGCTSGYGSNKTFKGRVYGFPEEERTTWLNALPSYINPSDVTVNMGICDLHWPSGVPTKKRNRWDVPAVPPSLFNLPSSYCRQTAPVENRDIGGRRVSQDARALSSQRSIVEVDEDIILSWENFIKYCDDLPHPTMKTDTGRIFGISSRSIVFYICIEGIQGKVF